MNYKQAASNSHNGVGNFIYGPFMGVTLAPLQAHLPLIVTSYYGLFAVMVLVFLKDRMQSKDGLCKGLFSKAKQSQHSKEIGVDGLKARGV